LLVKPLDKKEQDIILRADVLLLQPTFRTPVKGYQDFEEFISLFLDSFGIDLFSINPVLTSL